MGNITYIYIQSMKHQYYFHSGLCRNEAGRRFEIAIQMFLSQHASQAHSSVLTELIYYCVYFLHKRKPRQTSHDQIVTWFRSDAGSFLNPKLHCKLSALTMAPG